MKWSDTYSPRTPLLKLLSTRDTAIQQHPHPLDTGSMLETLQRLVCSRIQILRVALNFTLWWYETLKIYFISE